MSNHSLIYIIVTLNALCQAMLLWRLKFDKRTKCIYCALALTVPVLIAITMRLLVATDIMHAQMSMQNTLERAITSLASILLIAGPILVTILALYVRRRQNTVALQHQ